jgi:hypothetical protein
MPVGIVLSRAGGNQPLRDRRHSGGSGPRETSSRHGLPTPPLLRLVSPYFLVLEAVFAAFLAGFAFALAIGMPPSFEFAPRSLAKVEEVGRPPLGSPP